MEKMLWGLHSSSGIQLDQSRHTLTNQYFRTDLVKGIEFKWSKRAQAQEQIQHILAFLYTLTSGIPSRNGKGNSPVLSGSCLEAFISPTAPLMVPLFLSILFCIRHSEKEPQRIALCCRERFANMELVWFLSQLSNINNRQKRIGIETESVTFE